MLRDRPGDAGLQVRAGAHLQADLLPVDALCDRAEGVAVLGIEVLDQAHPVAEPLGAGLQRVGDRGGAVALPGVDRDAQPLGPGAGELRTEAGGGEARLGTGEVQPHHSRGADGRPGARAVGSPRERDLHQVVARLEMAQVAQQLADHDPAAAGLDRRDALVEPVLHGPDRLLEGQSAVRVLVRRPAGLRVHDPVGRHVLHELARDPAQVRRGLHERDGALEGREVLGQRAGVRGVVEPVGDLLLGDLLRGGLLRVRARRIDPQLPAQVDHGRGAQPAVEVVVQDDLGQGADEVTGQRHPRRIRGARSGPAGRCGGPAGPSRRPRRIPIQRPGRRTGAASPVRRRRPCGSRSPPDDRRGPRRP